MKKFFRFLLAALFVALLVAAYFYFRRPGNSRRMGMVGQWIRSPQEHADWLLPAGTQCPGAPFRFPTDGYVGFLWDDSFRIGHRHAGIDIFGGAEPGVTPIYAAYDGYLTRQADWKSSLIVRIPDDPLHPGRQVWTYYTHMADAQGHSFIDAAFPPGTHEVFVTAGTLLGHQGNFSGTPGQPVGVHLHFSVVHDDGQGGYTNELDIHNTDDPSPYFGLPLNGPANPGVAPACGG
ncbi:MAG: M23 family metallopeptidase [Chloroflexi bacterium]|jgi:hypothetical protein|nr:hypothetical protein [Anaerolineaceae bacterium]NMB87067.1 M23 family metallopeptidase [Chloroflexota bacterium]